MFILLGVYFALQEFLGQDSMVGGLLQASLILLMIGGMAVSRRLVNALKMRLTYPRVGYVEYRVDERYMNWRRLIVMVLAFAVSALTIVFVRMFESIDSIVAVIGVVVAGILVILRAKVSGLTRFYLLGAISLLLGLALSMSGLPNGYSLGLFYELMGICFLVSGGVTLRAFLDKNPLPFDAEGRNG